jgi:hypothetical protein
MDIAERYGSLFRRRLISPECHIEFPRLLPRLMPESTRSTFCHTWAPNATQSAGVLFTRYASRPLMGVGLWVSGRAAVMA